MEQGTDCGKIQKLFREILRSKKDLNILFEKCLQWNDDKFEKVKVAQFIMIRMIDIIKNELHIPAFDPEKEISADNFETLKRYLKSSKKKSLNTFFAEYAEAKILFPGKLEQAEYIDGADFEWFKEILNGKSFNWFFLADQLAQFKIIFPDSFEHFAEKYWEKLKDMLENFDDHIRNDKDFDSYSHYVMNLKICFPDKFKELVLPEGLFNSDNIFEERQLGHMGMPIKWRATLHKLKKRKIIDPEKFNDEKLTDAMWKEAKMEWKGCLPFDPGNYIHFAYSMKVLAAKAIEISDQGVDIRLR
jgi:hypothetical protein